MSRQDNKHTPRLRFHGFAGEWEEKKIGEIFQVTSGTTPLRSNQKYFNNGLIYWVKTTDLNNSILQKTEEKISDIALNETSLKILPKNTLFVAMYGGFNQIGRTGLLNMEATCNQALAAILPEKSQNPFYLLTYLNHSVEYWKSIAASSRKDPNITKQDILDFYFFTPTLSEQTAIGNFFRQLDHRIAESRARLEKSRQLKKAMLAKMFPAHGNTAPKLRFQGFTGEWERKQLGELGHCVSGVGFPEREQGGENGIPFFKVSDMNLLGNEVFLKKANHYVTQAQIDQNKWQPINQLPCIFFAKVGAALLLNRKRLVNQPFLLDNNTMSFIINDGLNDYFIKTLFDTIELPELAQIGALPSINAKDVESVSLMLPEKAEQTAIGNFFRQLDDTIALQAKETEKLNRLKKALLAKMLI